MNSAYADILEDVSKPTDIIEETDVIYRTDDAQVYSDFSNTSDVISIKTKDFEKWLVPSESTIRIRFQLTNSAETAAIANGENVTMIAGALHLFDQIRLIIDNNQIELVTRPGYVHLIEHLLTSSVDALKSVAENEWLYLDNGKISLGAYTAGLSTNDAFILSTATTGIAAEVNQEDGLADHLQYLGIDNTGADLGGVNPKYNSGFAARWVRTQAGKEVDLQIPAARIMGFFADVRTAFRGLQFELEFTKNTRYAEILHGKGIYSAIGADIAAAADASVLIKKIDWIVPSKIPSALMLEKVQRQLSSGKRTTKVFHSSRAYDFTKTNNVIGDNDVDWRIISTGKRITRVVVGFQRVGQYSVQNDPSFTATNADHNNGGVFTHLTDIKNIELRFGSKIIPRERYTSMSFSDASPNYLRNYVEFADTGGKWMDDDGCLVSYSKYKSLYPLFAFNLDGIDLSKNDTTTEDLRVVCTAETANTDNFRIIAVVQYEHPVDLWGVDGRLALELP